jgi:arginyl-tRNA synthetase
MKEQIDIHLKKALQKVVSDMGLNYPADVQYTIERPRDPSHGDFSSNIAMVLAKTFKVPPRVLAEKLLNCLQQEMTIAQVDLAGPGFINFKMKGDLLLDSLNVIWHESQYGRTKNAHPMKVVVDYSSPNLAKEMHVGHLRSTIIGDAIARVLSYQGHDVIRQNHVGDWGTQFGMLLAHFDDEQKAHAGGVKLTDLETFYKAAKQRFDQDAAFAERSRHWVVLLQSGDQHCLEMWKTFIHLSLSHCQDIYERLGVQLTLEDVRAESAYNADLPIVINELKQKGLLVEHDGAQCVFMDAFKGKDNEPLPVIVQKKDGGFLYASTDLAAIRYRQEKLHADRVLYVVDARQALHFQQIFALAKLAGYAYPSLHLEHISFGMVLDRSGRPYKSRDGGVTKLADLLDEAEKRAYELIKTKQSAIYPEEELKQMASVIGIASVKYADLSKHRTSDYVFDWDTMISFEGNTAPYLLYAYTRISSLFQKAHLTEQELANDFKLVANKEIELAKQLIRFSEIIDMVALKSTPHLLCSYLYELAGIFSSFYEGCPILNQDDHTLKESRLKLAALTARILRQGLSLLGIPVLNRM